jgi:hypothetical protein
LYNTVISEETFDGTTGEVIVTNDIELVSEGTVDCSIEGNASTYEQCKGNQGSIQKI